MVVFILWCIPLLLGATQLSRDVNSYAAQGKMVLSGLQPGTDSVSDLPRGPYRDVIDPLWAHTPAPYGPLANGVAAGIVAISGSSPALAVVLFRLMALASVLIAGLLVPRVASAVGTLPAHAFALGILNPVIVVHVVGGAHNDALMLPLLLAGVLLCVRGRRLFGILVTACAAAVKLPAMVAVGFEGWHWPGKGATLPRRIAAAAAATSVGVATIIALSLTSGLGLGWISAMGASSSKVMSSFAPATLLGLATTASLQTILAPESVDIGTVIAIWRAIAMAIGVVLSGMILLRSTTIGEVRSIGLVLIVLALAGPLLFPWYIAAGVVLIAAGGAGRWEPALVVLIIATCFMTQPSSSGTLSLFSVGRGWVGLAFWATAVAIAWFLVTRTASRGIDEDGISIPGSNLLEVGGKGNGANRSDDIHVR